MKIAFRWSTEHCRSLSGVSMAQEPYTKLEEAASSAPRRCRCSTTYVQVACQISCIVILIICVVSIERRLSFLEHRLDSMAEELRSVHSKHKGALGRHGAVALNKRIISDSTTPAKKVRTLKRRWEINRCAVTSAQILKYHHYEILSFYNTSWFRSGNRHFENI